MPFDFFPNIGLLLFSSIVFLIVHSAGTLTACALTESKWEKIVLFYGKPVFTSRRTSAPFASATSQQAATSLTIMQSFPNRPLLVRGFVSLAGLLAVSLSAMICLNIGHAAISFIATYPQLVKAHSRRDLLEATSSQAFLRKRASRYSWVTARLPQNMWPSPCYQFRAG